MLLLLLLHDHDWVRGAHWVGLGRVLGLHSDCCVLRRLHDLLVVHERLRRHLVLVGAWLLLLVIGRDGRLRLALLLLGLLLVLLLLLLRLVVLGLRLVFRKRRLLLLRLRCLLMVVEVLGHWVPVVMIGVVVGLRVRRVLLVHLLRVVLAVMVVGSCHLLVGLLLSCLLVGYLLLHAGHVAPVRLLELLLLGLLDLLLLRLHLLNDLLQRSLHLLGARLVRVSILTRPSRWTVVHVLEGLESEDLRCPSLSFFSYETLAQLLDEVLLGGRARVGTLRELQAAHKLLERVHLVVFDLVLDVPRSVDRVEDLLESEGLLSGDHFDRRSVASHLTLSGLELLRGAHLLVIGGGVDLGVLRTRHFLVKILFIFKVVLFELSVFVI